MILDLALDSSYIFKIPISEVLNLAILGKIEKPIAQIQFSTDFKNKHHSELRRQRPFYDNC